jgi:hypothetical protein
MSSLFYLRRNFVQFDIKYIIKKMEELSIVLGLIVIITVFIIYKKKQPTNTCDEHVSYFDKMYYDLPKLNTINDKPVNNNHTLNDMNSIKQQSRKVRNVGDNTNVMASRWASHLDLHDKNEVGSCNYTNTDYQVMPNDLHHKINKNSAKTTGNSKSHVDGFADDEWLDEKFSYNTK